MLVPRLIFSAEKAKDAEGRDARVGEEHDELRARVRRAVKAANDATNPRSVSIAFQKVLRVASNPNRGLCRKTDPGRQRCAFSLPAPRHGDPPTLRSSYPFGSLPTGRCYDIKRL